ncbi:isocitrate lyase/phosphoenolpyruvate mutase family protein [Magnetospirillum fulvum]|uniref:Methylisocitrate lyase n=1 Tax=Magnetospirillum fulvum TaxID=1082 RepID=A0A1H6J9U3_MAGFU|nr:isocitrate lyase/phosphoenolpyruvate mutase family protein [Magnetospirillum fulvum]SEH59004.1 methylisocitrate lyase [Magnetospirillum fulvum]
MLHANLSANDKRLAFRAGLASGKLQRFPGAFSPLSALLIEEQGFDGIYISGTVLSADLGLPDLGLATLSEVAQRGHQIARVTDLPSLIDVESGFGEAINVVRTIRMLEDLGLAGCHIKDRVGPNRSGVPAATVLVGAAEMARRIKAAASARRDSDFVLCARTDARASEGLDGVIARARAYLDAGADMIFAEAVADEREFEVLRRALPDTPLLANMSEFGPSKLLSARSLQNLGINMAIYPVTLLRLAMASAEVGLKTIQIEGSQASIVDRMHSGVRLDELLGHQEYIQIDREPSNVRV